MTPGDWDRLEEIRSDVDFDQSVIKKIDDLVADNPLTPAVIRDAVQKMYDKRVSEFQKYEALRDNLKYYGFEDDGNDPDKGQVGFKIPRDIFSNNFSGLIHELNFLKKLVRLVSEAEGENPEDIEVGSISTTDPVFWLIVAYGVAKSMGKLTDWALSTWKSVEEIRQIRAQTAQLKSFDPDEVEKIFGPKIEAQIKSAIEDKSAELASSVKPAARKNEISNGLNLSLREFLARVERGLTVDIRYLPPPQTADDADGDLASKTEDRLQEIQAVASALEFRRPAGEPILRLEAANDKGPSKPKIS
ncbi:hypothetical protein [Novosphingobium resinovorum]|uniref:hypothetical protein n=1 Tax=Novosphingobium resinovorum TaxID=158500 RepID=UPI0012DDC6CF|nr:hypothetical protein [Novosphingobium resinovorum]